MSQFSLIDLYDQRAAVIAHVQGWERDKILEWMKGFGIVNKLTGELDDDRYTFRSKVGGFTPFRLTQDGELIVFHPR
jgi:hypothetical protein